MKGGIGSFAYRHESLFVGAVAAVNCIGDVVDGRTVKSSQERVLKTTAAF
jgi:L-aminopeptidase/D-esterase-like protein